MLLFASTKFHCAFVWILRIWIFDHLRRMDNTLRLVLLQNIGTRKYVQTTAAYVTASCVSSTAGNQARHASDTRVA